MKVIQLKHFELARQEKLKRCQKIRKNVFLHQKKNLRKVSNNIKADAEMAINIFISYLPEEVAWKNLVDF